MTICKIILVPLITVVIALMTVDVYANLLIPLAATSSQQTLTATIDGSSFLSGVAVIQTSAYSRAVSTNPGLLTEPAIHQAQALVEGHIPNDGATIATFNSILYTSAIAFSNEPLFSKAIARSESSVIAEVAAPFSTITLNLELAFNNLNLQSEPVFSYAYFSDTIQVVQKTLTNSQETNFGFYIYLENGLQTTVFFGNSDVTSTLQNWFNNNMTQVGNQFALNTNSEHLNFAIPLTPQQSPFFLSITNIQTAISYEAPVMVAKFSTAVSEPSIFSLFILGLLSMLMVRQSGSIKHH